MHHSRSALGMLVTRWHAALKRRRIRTLPAICLLVATLAPGLAGEADAEPFNNPAGQEVTLSTDTTVDGTFTNAGDVTVQADLNLQQATIASSAGSQLIIAGAPGGSSIQTSIQTAAQLTELLKGSVTIGHPQNSGLGRAQLAITSGDITLSSDMFSASPQNGKLTMLSNGGINVNYGSATLNGDSFAIGSLKESSGYASRIKAASFYLNPTTGTTFELKSGRIYARGYAWENSVVQVGDGTGTLNLNGGSLRLGDADQAVVGGTVKGNIEVRNDGELRVSSGVWNMAGKLTVDSSGVFVVGKDTDDGGNPLKASLNVTQAELTGTGTLEVVEGSIAEFVDFKAAQGAVVTVGNDTTPGTFIAQKLVLGGAAMNFDPAFGAAGDTANASHGALSFSADTVDGLLTAGRNSMVSLGSTDAGWLRAEVDRYQKGGKGTWGQDITAALAVRAPQTLDAANGGITVDGTWTHGNAAATANTVKFAPQSLFVVDAAGVGDSAALSGEAGGTSTLTVDAGAKLHIVGGRGGQTVNITDRFGPSTKDAASWTDANLTTGTALLSATAGPFDATTGAYSVTLTSNASAEVFPKLSGELAALVDQMAIQPGVDVNSSQPGVRFLSRALSDNYIGTTDTTLAAATVESAARLALIGAVPQMTWAAHNAAGTAVSQRTGLADPGNGLRSMDEKGEAVDNAATGFAMWIMPLYQSWNGFGLEGGHFDLDVNGGLGGVAIGADYTFADAIRAGITFNVGGGYAQGSGDFNKTTNTMSFWGIGAYLGWSPADFGLTADVQYTATYNDVEQELPAEMHMGNLKSDITAHALSAGLRGEYRLATTVLDIIPHAGVRYTCLTTNDYDVRSNGTVMEGDALYQNIWTFPVGVAFSKELATDGGWHFKPGLDLAVIPAAGDIKARGDVRFTGVSQSAEVETQTMDYLTWMAQAGIEFGNETVSLGVNYNLQAGAHTTAHGVFGTFRYEF